MENKVLKIFVPFWFFGESIISLDTSFPEKYIPFELVYRLIKINPAIFAN